MPFSPEYRAMIAKEVSVRQSPAEQRRLIEKQQASLDILDHHICQSMPGYTISPRLS